MLIEKDNRRFHKLKEQYSFEHLKPSPEIYEIVIPQSDYFVENPGRQRRRIFYRVPYNQEEETAIKEVKARLKEYSIFEKFPDEVILKHIYAGGFVIEKVMERLKNIQQFHNNPVITTFTEKTLKKLKTGCIYTYGHDKGFRPIVIIQASKFDLTLNMQQNYNIVYFLMLVVMGIRTVPYHAEKYVCIFDLNNMPISEIPFRYLKDLVTSMSVYYSGNVEKTLIYNANSIDFLWKIGKRFIPEHAKKKIKFVETGKESEVHELIDPFELQVKYGGKLDNLKEYWPPQSTNEEFDHLGIHTRRNLEQTDFFTVNNDHEYFLEEGQEPFCGSSNCKCNIF